MLATSITGLQRFLDLQVMFCKIMYFNTTNSLMKYVVCNRSIIYLDSCISQDDF